MHEVVNSVVGNGQRLGCRGYRARARTYRRVGLALDPGMGVACSCRVLPHDMEFHAVEEGVIVDWASVCSASTKRLKVGFSRPNEILVCDRRKWQQLDLVDLDRHGTTPVDAADLHLRSRPEPVRDRDGSVCHSLPEIRAELHAAIVAPAEDAEPAARDGVLQSASPSREFTTLVLPFAYALRSSLCCSARRSFTVSRHLRHRDRSTRCPPTRS